jgi:hypothetical protein
MQTTDKPGVMHFNVTPSLMVKPKEVKEGEKPEPWKDVDWTYTLDFAVVQSTHINPQGNVCHILPGVRRSLVYMTSPDERDLDAPKLLKMRRYHNPDFRPNNYEDPMHDQKSEPLLRTGRFRRPHRLYADAALPDEMQLKLSEEGISSITYDEHIGRLCVVSGRDPNNLMVVDYASAAPLDDRITQFMNLHCLLERFVRNLQDEAQSMMVVEPSRPESHAVVIDMEYDDAVMMEV